MQHAIIIISGKTVGGGAEGEGKSLSLWNCIMKLKKKKFKSLSDPCMSTQCGRHDHDLSPVGQLSGAGRGRSFCSDRQPQYHMAQQQQGSFLIQGPPATSGGRSPIHLPMGHHAPARWGDWALGQVTQQPRLSSRNSTLIPHYRQRKQ